MKKKVLDESLVRLYLRLNGYFTSGFIVHSPRRSLTEIDVLGVRFPNSNESEVGMKPAVELDVPSDAIDLVICEVKGGQRRLRFNGALTSSPYALASALSRAGVLDPRDVSHASRDLLAAIEDANGIPTVRLRNGLQVRALLFATGREAQGRIKTPLILGHQVLNYIWKRLRPDEPRLRCATTYNYEMWGEPDLIQLVRYFKKRKARGAGTVQGMVRALCS